MDISILYNTVFEQCQMLSSFEGREAVSPSGESDYVKVHMTEQDLPLVKTYIVQASGEVEKNLGKLIQSATNNSEGITFSIAPIDDKRIVTATLKKMIEETIHSWVLMQWCSLRLPSRQQFYQSLFVEMIDGVKRIAYRKKSPILTTED